MSRALLVALGLLLLSTSITNAQEGEKKQPEKLPPPRFEPQPEKLPAPTPVAPAPTFIEPYVIRAGTREVWEHYGVSSLGRFVPRVIGTPYGDFYSRDLQPYPWRQNRSTAIMP